MYRDPNVFPPTPKNTAIDRLKELWNDQPLVVIGVAAGATASLAKLIDAVTKASNSRVWKREVRRRETLGKRP